MIVSKALSVKGALSFRRMGSLNVSFIFVLYAASISPCAGLNTTVGGSTSDITKVTDESGIALPKESSTEDPIAA